MNSSITLVNGTHRRVIGLLLGLLATLFAVLPARAADAITVTASGVGAILNGDHARARDEALRDAYRLAAEQAGVRVCSESEVRDFQLFFDRVTTRSDGYVRGYRIVSEGPQGDLYHCTIEATVVPTGPMREDPEALATLIDMLGNPTVLVLVEDSLDGRSVPLGRAFSVILDRLNRARYHTIDPEQLKRIQEKDLVDQALSGDERAGRILAERFGADILITGSVQASPNTEVRGGQGSLFSARSRNNIRAVLADTGQVLASDSTTGKGLRLSFDDACLQALEDSAGRAADALAWKLPQAYDARSGGVRELQLRILGCTFQQQRQVVEALREMRTVSGVFPREFRGDVAVIDVRSGLAAEDVVARLEAAGFTFQVQAATANRLEIRLR